MTTDPIKALRDLYDIIIEDDGENCECWSPRYRAVMDAAKAALAAPTLPRWQHLKLGGTYTETCRARVKTSIPIGEGDVLVVYRAEADGEDYARPVREFEDGRFVRVLEREKVPA